MLNAEKSVLFLFQWHSYEILSYKVADSMGDGGMTFFWMVVQEIWTNFRITGMESKQHIWE